MKRIVITGLVLIFLTLAMWYNITMFQGLTKLEQLKSDKISSTLKYRIHKGLFHSSCKRQEHPLIQYFPKHIKKGEIENDSLLIVSSSKPVPLWEFTDRAPLFIDVRSLSDLSLISRNYVKPFDSFIIEDEYIYFYGKQNGYFRLKW